MFSQTLPISGYFYFGFYEVETDFGLLPIEEKETVTAQFLKNLDIRSILRNDERLVYS